MKTLGERIADFRRERGITQEKPINCEETSTAV